MSKKIIISLLVIGLLIGTVSFVNAAKRKKEVDVKKQNLVFNVQQHYTDFPLKQGSKGIAVKMMQNYFGITQDGIFGKETFKSAQIFGDIGIISKRDFLRTILLRPTSQIEKVFPMQMGDLDSFAIAPLQMMIGASVTDGGIFDDETDRIVKLVFLKDTVTYEDYTALVKHVFMLTNEDLTT